MKKQMILLLATFLQPAAGDAQGIAFGYDASGNRITRSLSNNSNQAPRMLFMDEDSPETTQQSVSVGPNPTTGILRIRLSRREETDNCHLLLSDLSGKTLIERDMETYETSLNLTPFPDGLYLLSVELNGVQQSYKIIKN